MGYKFAVITKIDPVGLGEYEGGNHATDVLYIVPSKRDHLLGSGCYVGMGTVNEEVSSLCYDGGYIFTGKTKIDLEKPGVLSVLTPVFSLGEILVLGPNGREVAYMGRKPGKWDVEYQVFDTIEEAVACSLKVTGMDE